MNRLSQLSKLLLIMVAIAGLTFVVTGNVVSANNSTNFSLESYNDYNDSKCGEGKCGGDSEESAKESKCGEGKCGEGKEDCDGKCDHDKSTEAKCGEGKCGGDSESKEAVQDAKCGEGKCG